MSKIKFPPLQKGLTKFGGEFVISDYIHMIDHHAILMHPDYMIAVNLQEYFYLRKDPNAEPDYIYENAIDVLDFLDRKQISASFWNELVSAPALRMSDDDTHIIIGSRGTTKELYYIEPKEVEGDEIKKALNENMTRLLEAAKYTPLGSKVTSVDMGTLLKISQILNIKDDVLVLENFGESKPVRFSFGETPYCFGVIANNYQYNTALYLDQSLTNFIDLLKAKPEDKKRKSVKELLAEKGESHNVTKKAVDEFQQTMSELDVEFEIIKNDA